MSDYSMKFDIKNVDFTDITSVRESAKSLIESAAACGLLTSVKTRQSAEGQSIIATARVWVDKVSRHFQCYSPGEALSILSSFDVLHRVVYLQPADKNTTNQIKKEALDAYIHGDKSVDVYDLYEAIGVELRSHNIAFIDRPLAWSSEALGRWYRNFSSGKSAMSQSPYDTMRQVRILLDEDLFAFAPDPVHFKTILRSNHLSLL